MTFIGVLQNTMTINGGSIGLSQNSENGEILVIDQLFREEFLAN